MAKRKYFSPWWYRRWMAPLEVYDLGNRLRQGRSLARRGHVIDVDRNRGYIESTVRDRTNEHRTEIKVEPWSKKQWKKFLAIATSQVAHASKLLAGEISPELVDECDEKGLSLFPDEQEKFGVDCNCRSQFIPCAHVVATYLHLGTQIEEDPFVLLEIRGRDRKYLVEKITPGAGTPRTESPTSPDQSAPSWTRNLNQFWKGPDLPPFAIERPHQVEEGLVQIPGKVKGKSVVQWLGRWYRQVEKKWESA